MVRQEDEDADPVIGISERVAKSGEEQSDRLRRASVLINHTHKTGQVTLHLQSCPSAMSVSMFVFWLLCLSLHVPRVPVFDTASPRPCLCVSGSSCIKTHTVFRTLPKTYLMMGS